MSGRMLVMVLTGIGLLLTPAANSREPKGEESESVYTAEYRAQRNLAHAQENKEKTNNEKHFKQLDRMERIGDRIDPTRRR